jgi:tetratricopeptide (TPR) repeat protein
MHALPDVLVERLRNRQAILVAGAGCSELAQLPGWAALGQCFLEWVTAEEDKAALADLLQKGRMTSALAFVRELFHESTLGDVLADAYGRGVEVPDAIRTAAHAPWRGFVTTTFDTLWATALADDAEVVSRTAFAANASSLEHGHGRFLLQIFGRADVPASLCLAPAEIPAKIGATGAAAFLAGLYHKWSFVFVGYQPDDPDLTLLTQRVLGATETRVPHFLLAPQLSDSDARLVRTELGLVPVSVDASLQETLAALAYFCAQPGRKPADDDVEAWLELVVADPGDREAHEGLDRGLAHLRERKEWERMVGIMISRAEVIHEPASQAAALCEVALLLEQELDATDRAYPVMMTALRLRPRDPDLLADAKRLAEKAGQWDDFANEVAHLEHEGADAADSTQIALGVARVCARDTARVDEAIAAFGKVLDRDPQNPEALAELENLYRETERWVPLRALYEKMLARDPHNNAAFAKLEELYRKTEQWAPLTSLLEKELARNPADPAAFAKLEEIYRKTEQTKALTDLLRKALARNPTDGATFAKLEQLYRRTEQWKPLVEMLEALTARDPANGEALAKLEELYRKTEQWTLLCDLLEMRAQRKGDPELARGLRMERASLLLDKLKDVESALVVAQVFAAEDPDAAEALYLRALDSDPDSAVALAALADLCSRKREFERAAKFALQGAEKTKNPMEKGRLLAQAGILALDQFDDPEAGLALLERALAADPEQVSAAQRLAKLREARQEWLLLEPVLDMLLRRAPAEDDATRADLHERVARCAQRLGKMDKALANFEAATRLLPHSLPLAQASADLHFSREAWAEAGAAYERVYTLGRTGLTAPERAALCVRMATCAERLADSDRVLHFREEAAALEPHERSHLDALIALRTARQEWSEVVDLRRKQLALVSDEEERAQLWDELGDVLRDKLNDSADAVACYTKALAVQPERRQTLYKMLDHYSGGKQWAKAVETLEKLSELETEPTIRARGRYTLAAIYRDEMQDNAKAVEVFTQVLEDDPMFVRAFDAIERILTESRSWKELARAYRRQLKRLPAEAPTELKLRLWDALAAVAIKHLKNRESAVLALEVAASLDRDNFARQEQLAQMYHEAGPQAVNKTIAQHQMLVSKKPDRIASYQALAPLFYQTGAHDRMWCVAAALVYLGKADAPLASFYESYRPTQLPSAAGKMNEELWRKILHPAEDPYVSALLALLAPAIAMSSASPHKAIGVDRSDRVDLSGAAWPHAAALRYVANTIEGILPDVFLKKDAPGTVSIVNLKEKNTLTPALVVGPGFEQWTRQSEVIFDLAKRMVLMRSERFPRFALGTPALLEIALRAGLLLGGCPIGNGPHGDEVDKMAKLLDPLLSSALRAELKVVARKFVEARGDRLDLLGWIVASDLTAARAALALCGDLGAAARVLAVEPSGQSPLSARERINDLLAFSVSEDHFAVRAALGLHVNLTPPAPEAGSLATAKRRMSHTQIKSAP